MISLVQDIENHFIQVAFLLYDDILEGNSSTLFWKFLTRFVHDNKIRHEVVHDFLVENEFYILFLIVK